MPPSGWKKTSRSARNLYWNCRLRSKLPLHPPPVSMHSILIVDDESAIQQSLKGVLEDEGYKASVAGKGGSCLDVLHKTLFDLGFVDIWLPGVDGLGNLQRIREIEKTPQVIMISPDGTIENPG